MEIPSQLIYDAVATIGTALGISIVHYLRQLLKEVKNLSSRNEKLEKTIYKIALIISQCKKCPHPDLKFLEELETEIHRKDGDENE